MSELHQQIVELLGLGYYPCFVALTLEIPEAMVYEVMAESLTA